MTLLPGDTSVASQARPQSTGSHSTPGGDKVPSFEWTPVRAVFHQTFIPNFINRHQQYSSNLLHKLPKISTFTSLNTIIVETPSRVRRCGFSIPGPHTLGPRQPSVPDPAQEDSPRRYAGFSLPTASPPLPHSPSQDVDSLTQCCG